MNPTEEQIVVADCFKTGGSVRVQAGAGTGKTSTLKYLSEGTRKRGAYLAFNRALVEDAKLVMPRNVKVSTIHSVAFRAEGVKYRHRLDSGRMRSDQIAKMLGIETIFVDAPVTGRKMLSAGYLAGQVMRALRNFCQSADLVPLEEHFSYIDGIDGTAEGKRGWTNNNQVRRYLAPKLTAAWEDVSDPAGQLRFEHAHYLKVFALSDHPIIHADFIMVDEYQDVAPVMQQIINRQARTQVIGVGDSAQSIYGFTGAVDALEQMQADHDAWLTQSFRFGPAIAEQANKILAQLGSQMKLRGTDAIPSVVGYLTNPKAILTRTNATGVSTVLSYMNLGKKVHMVGGGEDVIRFALAVLDLKRFGKCDHPELACFSGWGEVQRYVTEDPQGSDLKLMVDLMDEFGPDVIVDQLRQMPDERQAELIVSTAHKSKGRQWDTVQLAGDFPDGSKHVSDDELRLLYVAATRARRHLDVAAVGALADKPKPTAGITQADVFQINQKWSA